MEGDRGGPRPTRRHVPGLPAGFDQGRVRGPRERAHAAESARHGPGWRNAPTVARRQRRLRSGQGHSAQQDLARSGHDVASRDERARQQPQGLLPDDRRRRRRLGQSSQSSRPHDPGTNRLCPSRRGGRAVGQRPRQLAGNARHPDGRSIATELFTSVNPPGAPATERILEAIPISRA